MANVKVQWQTASPLWEKALKDTDSEKKRFNRPAILRFDSDNFMEDLEAILNNTPSKLTDKVVQYETWEQEGAGWLDRDKEEGEATSLKLYHPAHARFYLVAASLACRKPGLPDKCIDIEKGESVSFVMRRLVTENGQENEYGWVMQQLETGNGQEKKYSWQKVESPLSVSADEERFPLFTMNFKDRDCQRRLLTGFIPVSSKETFQAPPNLNPLTISEEDLEAEKANEDPLADLRVARFEGSVVAGMKSLRTTLEYPPPPSTEEKISTSEVQEVFLFCLYDFAYFVEKYLDGDASSISGLDVKTFFTYVENSNDVVITWLDALNEVMAGENMENIMLGTITTLEFISPEMVADENDIKDNIKDAIENLQIVNESAEYEKTYEFSESFKGDIEDALPDIPISQLMAAEPVPEVPRNGPGAYYVIRCVYERPQCKGIHSPVVSEPSRRFQLASFFEPDAPTRPVSITLPENTGIAGLRKFKKNVSVLVSKKLRSQMQRMTGLKLGDLDDGNINEDPGFNLGMICSLSIPIITICALILLMIIVQLLDIIFRWMPFFKICFPKKS